MFSPSCFELWTTALSSRSYTKGHGEYRKNNQMHTIVLLLCFGLPGWSAGRAQAAFFNLHLSQNLCLYVIGALIKIIPIFISLFFESQILCTVKQAKLTQTIAFTREKFLCMEIPDCRMIEILNWHGVSSRFWPSSPIILHFRSSTTDTYLHIPKCGSPGEKAALI